MERGESCFISIKTCSSLSVSLSLPFHFFCFHLHTLYHRRQSRQPAFSLGPRHISSGYSHPSCSTGFSTETSNPFSLRSARISTTMSSSATFCRVNSHRPELLMPSPVLHVLLWCMPSVSETSPDGMEGCPPLTMAQSYPGPTSSSRSRGSEGDTGGRVRMNEKPRHKEKKRHR